MIKYAPIVITTLNRDKHFIRCIESLANCTHANESDLYIGLDYPLNDSHWEGYRKIENYLKQICGFKTINIFKRDKNFGAIKNSEDLFEKVFNKYDRLIETEDDNEFSPNFLDYLNKGLSKFENENKVSFICAYNGIIKMSNKYNPAYYFNKSFVGWGFALWKNKYTEIIWDYKQLESFISEKKNKSELKSLFPQHYYTVKSKIKDKGILHGDGIIPLLNIMNDTYCVYPTISLVRNHGFDGSGVHCSKIEYADKYHKQVKDNNTEFSFIGNPPVEIDPLIWSTFKKQTKPSFIKRIKYQLKLNSCIAPIINFFCKKTTKR